MKEKCNKVRQNYAEKGGVTVRGKKAILSLLLCACTAVGNPITTQAQEVVVTVRHPGEGKDASAEIQSAIEEAKTVEGPVTIQFEEGKQYEVWPEDSYHTTGYYISNSATKSENPNGERWSAILLKDMEDVTIDGNGSLMMVHGVMTPILIDGSENIRFENFSLDYARPTVSEFTVLEKEGNTVKVKVHEDSLYELQDRNQDGKNDNILWVGEQKKSNENERYWASNATLMQEYDPVNETVRRIGMYGWGNEITDLGDNVLEMKFSGNSGYREGCTYQVRDGIRNQVGTFIHESKNVTFEDSNFRYMHGLGIVGQYSENITLKSLDCAPRKESGRTCAGFADFVQMSGCKGDVIIEDSHFSGSHDDTFNIHGTHLRIVEKNEAENRVKVRFMHNQSWGFRAFHEGDEIEFINGSTLNPYQKNVVKAVERLNDTDIILTLEDELPDNIQMNYDAIENITYTPNVTIRNNFSEYVPTRGLLCTTRGKVVVEGNTFKKHGMAAILLEDDARGWFESGLIRDMTIQNNTFEDCVSPQIHSNPQMLSADPKKPVHSNISILENDFTGQAVSLNLIGTKNILIEGNKFPASGGNISFNGCNGFEVKNNENQTNVRANNSINEKSMAELKVESVSNSISKEGMTATANNEWKGDGGSNPPYPAQNVLDDDENTFWSTDWNNVPEDDIYIEIDLNGKKTFNQFSYLPRIDETNARILKYELYAQNDAKQYEKIAEGAWANTPDRKYAEFDTVQTDKVKLVVKQTSMSWDNRKVVMAADMSFHNGALTADGLPIGKNMQLKVSATGNAGMPTDLTDAVFEYESSNEKVAVVNENGVVTAKGAGTAEITVKVTAYGTTLSRKVTVTVSDEIYVSAEKIQIKEVDQTVTGAIQLKAEVEPKEAAEDVRWQIVSGKEGVQIDENTGLLTVNGTGRITVKAYSNNNLEVSDTEEILISENKSETTKDWEWVRENPSKWSVDANGNLNVTLEKAAIWVENSAKNILLTSANEKDYEVVTKMNFKPQEDYTEAGLIIYENDENYVVLSRKVHPGYRPNEKNIFSMLTRSAGQPWESPAENVVPDDLGDSVYLKLKKEGNVYSGYYSADQKEWTKIYENRKIDLGENPKVGLIGYVAGSEEETAVYEQLSVNGENYPFDELKTELQASSAMITEIVSLEDKTVDIGTAFADLGLPKTVKVIWNGTYEETLPVTWNEEGYNPDKNGSYTIYGNLTGIEETNIEAGERPQINITVEGEEPLQKEALTALIAYAQEQKDSPEYQYVVPIVKNLFEQALADAEAVNAKTDATQKEVNAAYEMLLSRVHLLSFTGNSEDLQVLVDVAKGLNEKIYTPESWKAVEKALAAAESVLANENALQEEIDAARSALQAAMDQLVINPVDKSKLQNLVTKAQKYADQIDEYTPATAEGFLAALEGANAVLTNESATQEEVDAAYITLQNAIFGLRLIPNKDKLEDLIKEVESMNFDLYTVESVSVVKVALDKAVAVMEDANADEKAVEDATYQLAKAVEELQEAEKDDMQKPSDTGDAANVMVLMMAGLAAVFAAAIAWNKRIHHR